MTPTVAGLVAALKQSALLDAAQLAETEQLAARSPDLIELCRELTRRGWVTVYQLKQLFQGKGTNLVLKQYAVLDLLGEGGMGQVLKARHRRLDRIDALKVIRAEHVAQPDALRRFLREARAAARLRHQNIVTVYDADEVDGTHFIAMEYIEGVDLAQIVKAVGPLNVGQACDYVRQAAVGLQHAHEQGMVHRDIKPANLLVTADATTVKILDMGLARLHNLEEEADGKSALTQTGVVMGTPDYMAPEQAIDSSTVDIRADIYSLGCTLYYLLCGAPPFPQGSLTQKLLWHQQRAPEPIETRRPDLPAELVTVIGKLMAKKLEDRYQTPGEAARALEPFIALDIPAPTADLGGATLAPGELRSDSEMNLSIVSQARKPPARVEEMDFSFCTSGGGLVGALSLSTPVAVSEPTVIQPSASPTGTPAAATPTTDRTEVVPVRSGKKKRKRRTAEREEPDEPESINWYTVVGVVGFVIAALAIFWPQISSFFTGKVGGTGPELPGPPPLPGPGGPPRILPGKELLRIDHPGTVWSAAFLPDGKQAVTASLKSLVLYDLASGTRTRRLEEFPGAVLAVGCAGKSDLVLAGCAAGGPGSTLRRWNLQGRPDNIGYDSTRTVMTLALSPDGQYVATGGRSNDGEASPVEVWEVSSGVRLHTLQGHRGILKCVTFSRDGKQVAACGLDSTVSVWDLATPEQASLRQKFEARILALAFTADGKDLIVGGENNTLAVYNLATKKYADPTGFQGHTVDILCVAISPDGKRLLSGSGDKTVRLWEVASRKSLAVLEGHTDIVTSVGFSPDGTHALSTSQDKTARLWLLP